MYLYPLKFRPRFVEKMWGGRKLQSVLGKDIPAGKNIGESWELYDFPPGVVDASVDWLSSEIANGALAGRTLHWAVREFGPDLYGNATLVGEQGQFPILIKFLDAREDLSVQVHPDQAYARANPGCHLKSEAWYVMQRDPGSRLLIGLKTGATRDAFDAALNLGQVEPLIRAITPQPGDCFYLPSGTVHALGAGILVAEVQTPSDTTFRVFDFNRIDPSTGKPRALHIQQALKCIDFSPTSQESSVQRHPAGPMVDCPFFKLHEIQIGAAQEHQFEAAGPRVLIGIHGTAEVPAEGGAVAVTAGEVVLIPAARRQRLIRSHSGGTLVEVRW